MGGDGFREAEAFVAAALLDLLFVRGGEAGEEEGVVGDFDGLPQGEVFVVGDEDGHGAAVALEEGLRAFRLALANQVARFFGEVEDVEAFHETEVLRYSRKSAPSFGWRRA